MQYPALCKNEFANALEGGKEVSPCNGLFTCVRVCVRERERERWREKKSEKNGSGEEDRSRKQ